MNYSTNQLARLFLGYIGLYNTSLTFVVSAGNLYPSISRSAGIGLPESTAQAAINAVFLRAKSQFLIIMSGWAGSRKTGRFVDPVDQPVQSGTMIGLMLSGLKTYQRTQS